mmetsp:Transcript_127959/g.370295  ORF Transcript_127959/g.370295 Transcript_127959/m.370295 type:complete len:232 (+) Transcript_127959:81-776(+)
MAFKTLSKSICRPPLNCSCWKQRMRALPWVAMTWFLRSAAASTTKSEPATTCQIVPKSAVRRRRISCARACMSCSRSRPCLSSSRRAATTELTSEPSSTTAGSMTRRAGPSGLPLSDAVSLGDGDASAAASASGCVSAAGGSGSSMPGDCQITTIVSSIFQMPIVLLRFLQAKPSCSPTSTCQCSPKLSSKESFSAFAKSDRLAALVFFLSFVHVVTHRLYNLTTASWMGC